MAAGRLSRSAGFRGSRILASGGRETLGSPISNLKSQISNLKSQKRRQSPSGSRPRSRNPETAASSTVGIRVQQVADIVQLGRLEGREARRQGIDQGEESLEG